MFGGLNRTLAVAVVAAAVLVVPPAALACNSGVSAVNVYKECLPSGGGGGSTSSTSFPISKQTALALKRAGADGKSLEMLVNGYGTSRMLQVHSSGATAPTAVGSAFDLGSGPTALLIALAGAGVIVLAAVGFRTRRRR